MLTHGCHTSFELHWPVPTAKTITRLMCSITSQPVLHCKIDVRSPFISFKHSFAVLHAEQLSITIRIYALCQNLLIETLFLFSWCCLCCNCCGKCAIFIALLLLAKHASDILTVACLLVRPPPAKVSVISLRKSSSYRRTLSSTQDCFRQKSSDRHPWLQPFSLHAFSQYLLSEKLHKSPVPQLSRCQPFLLTNLSSSIRQVMSLKPTLSNASFVSLGP